MGIMVSIQSIPYNSGLMKEDLHHQPYVDRDLLGLSFVQLPRCPRIPSQRIEVLLFPMGNLLF